MPSKLTRVNIGRLRHKIHIQTLSSTDVDGGGQSQTWSTTFSPFARVENVYGNERLRGMQVTPGATHIITMRYDSRITEDKRILFGSRTFDIVFIDNVEERNHKLILDCKEIK